jgi:uncharacterized YccA/Bax inhibitor family protein
MKKTSRTEVILAEGDSILECIINAIHYAIVNGVYLGTVFLWFGMSFLSYSNYGVDYHTIVIMAFGMIYLMNLPRKHLKDSTKKPHSHRVTK